MRRRKFLGVLGGTAIAWPLAARAQQTIPVVGLLVGGSPDADAFRIAAFKQGLSAMGFVDGRNVAFEYRWADGKYDRLPALMADLVALRVTAIVSVGNAASRAARLANTTIPIVFEIGTDPVKFGLVTSLARPEGNLTGVTFLSGSLSAKQFEVLHEAVPTASVIGLLENPINPNASEVRQDVQAAAGVLGKKLVIANAVAESGFEAAFATFAQQQVAAVLVRSDVLFNGRPKQLVALASRHKLPAVFPLREFPAAGGLMSYGASLPDAMRQVGVYTGRVLKGEKPSDLPVHQAAKVELVVNLKAAKALGLDMPQTLLARADEVIE
jgi:putative ABC transport system substrate-binding protein